MKKLISFFFLIFYSFSAQAESQDREAKRIEGLLMAPCCWGSTVAEHDSDIALQMKDEIRTLLTEGKTEQEILNNFEAKFGERILARPKSTPFNLVVWIFPAFLLLVGGAFLVRFLKKKTPVANEVEEVPDSKYLKQLNQELYGSQE